MEHPEIDGHLPGQSTEPSGPGAGQYQQLWFSLARRPWSSLVLVPADGDGSADELALRLGEVGKRLSGGPVTVITVKSLDYDTASALADLPRYVESPGQAPAATWSAIEMPPSSLVDSDPGEGQPSPGAGDAGPDRNERALMKVSPMSEGRSLELTAPRLIISIPPVLTNPLGLATAYNADLVVVCVELGQTHIASARRTIDLVGRDRVAGCFLIHGGRG